MKFKDRDYSFLKGWEVNVVQLDSSIIHCFCAGADIDKGISIVLMDDPNVEVACLNVEENESHWNYYGGFACIVRGLRKGVIDINLLADTINKCKNSVSRTICGHYPSCGFK